MKKFLALVLALLMALSCFSFAGAEGGTAIPGTSDEQCNDGKAHTWVNEGDPTASTCTIAGSQKQKCSVCGATRILKLDLLPHVPAQDAESKVVSFADCTKAMVKSYTKCANCGEAFEVSEGNPLGHDWDAGVKTAETCTTDGYTLYTCKRCGATEKRDHVAKHAFEKSTDKKPMNRPATCEQEGIEGDVYYCTKCGHVPTQFEENGQMVNNTAKYLPKLTHEDTDFFTYDADDICTGLNATFVTDMGVADVYGKEAFTKTTDLSAKFMGKAVTVEYKPATCEEDGSVSVTCSCGYTHKEVLPALKHSFKMVSIEYYNANKENVLFKESNFGFPRTFEEFIEVMEKIQTGTTTGLPAWAPLESLKGYYDCTKPALVTYKCEKCGELRNAEEKPSAKDHRWYPASYTQMKYGTQKAGTFEHFEDINECTDYTITWKCRLCSQTKTEEVKGKGHDFSGEGTVLEVATCTSEGLVLHQCGYGDCQKKQLEVTEKLPHTKASEKVIKAASCTEEGQVEYTCTCGYKWTEVTPSLGGHNYKKVTTVEPTCTKKGHVKVVCAVCGDLKEEYDIPEGHKIPDTLTAATNAEVIKVNGKNVIRWKDCTKAGEATYTCADPKCCQVVIVKHTACDHTWNKGTKDLNSVKTTKIDDVSHLTTWNVDYVCTECATGKKTVKMEQTTKHVPAKDDDDGNVIEEIVDIATCKEAGLKLVKCADCGSYYKVSYTKSHVYSSQYDPATDKWTYKCIWCDAVKDVEFNAPSFTIDTTGITKATQTLGTGKIKLGEDMVPMVSDVYVYLRWTYTLANGDDFVFDTTVDVKWLNNAHTEGTFKAKGPSAPTGSKLTKMTIIVTNNANADDLKLNQIPKFGYVIL